MPPSFVGRAYDWALRRVFVFALRVALGEALEDLDADQVRISQSRVPPP